MPGDQENGGVSLVSNDGSKAEASCNAYVAILVAMAGALMFGIDQGNYGLVQNFQSFYDFWCVPNFQKGTDFPCKPDTDGAPSGWTTFISLGGSLITVGAAFGTMTVGPLVSAHFGRRACVSCGGIVCFVGTLFASYLTANSVYVYYIGRFVTGFGVGICCFVLPMYSSEVATPSIRGSMGSFFQFMVVLGGVIASLLLAQFKNLNSGNGNWQLGMVLPGFAGAVVAIAIWFAPESPRFAMDKKGYDHGLAMLEKVRKGNCETEARAMQEESQREREAGQVSYGELLAKNSEPPNRRIRVFTACFMQVAQQLTGVNAFLSYTTKIFEEAGIPKDNVSTAAIYFNLLMLAGCVAGLISVDSKFGGRRSQLLFATVLMGPPLVIAGIAKLSEGPAWISIAAVGLYGPGFQFAWGIVPWIYPAEIFSMNERDRAVSVATTCNFAINFLVNVITPPLLKWSPGGSFVLFGGLNVLNFFFVTICVKETKGVPLDQATRLFGEGSSARNLVSLSNQDSQQVS